jgi:succinoglycan biosynthesis protein ExoL
MTNTTDKLHVLFFTTATEHRTFRKTAKMLLDSGLTGLFCGLTRCNYPPAMDALPTIVFGEIPHGRYTLRLVLLGRHLLRLRQLARQHQLMHCFSLDALCLGYLATLGLTIPLVYQVQDIRPILLGAGIKCRIARFLERQALRRVAHLIVSSHAYYQNYFEVRYGFASKNLSIIENKVEFDPLLAYSLNVEQRGVNVSPLRIGYFGVLRCSRSWEILKEAVRIAEGGLELFVRGKPLGLEKFEDDILSLSHISFGGAYRDPDELLSLYAPVDLVWVSYPFGHSVLGNWQWARTVRFYEAGAFCRPMIAQEGTQDAMVIAKYNIGLNLDLADPQTAVKKLLAIRSENIFTWTRNLREMPRSTFVHKDEYSILRERLEQLIQESSNELA